MIFAAITLPELVPIFTVFGGMLAGFYAISKFMIVSGEKEREADRAERKELSGAISSMAVNMDKVAVSNQRIADESKQRNGHLGALIVKQGEIAIENKDQIIKQIKGLVIDKQTVHHQTVEHETVKQKE